MICWPFSIIFCCAASLKRNKKRIRHRAGEKIAHTKIHTVFVLKNKLLDGRNPYICFLKILNMPVDISKIFQKKKQHILEAWIKNQLANDALREDLISSEEARSQSEELLDALLNKLRVDKEGGGPADGFDPVVEFLETLSITRARKGYSPRETGAFLFSLKNALLKTLSE